MWSFMHIIQDGNLRAYCDTTNANCMLHLDFNHVAACESATLGVAVNQCFIEVKYQSFRMSRVVHGRYLGV